MVEQWHNDGGPEEQLWWKSGQRWWNRGTVMVKQWKRDGRTVEQ